MKICKYFGVLIALMITTNVWAQEVMDISEVVTVEAKSEIPSKEKLYRDISLRVTKDHVRQILGETKFEKSTKALATRIYPHMDKFIPVAKNTPFSDTGGGQMQSTVSLKLSIRDLRLLLLKEGLLSSNDATPTAVSFVSINDRVNGKSYRWWLPDPVNMNPSLHELSQRCVTALAEEFNDKGFYMADPKNRNLRDLIPTPFLAESFRPQDLSFIGDFLGYEIIVTGRVLFSRSSQATAGYRISVELEALQSSNGQSIAEVIRHYEVRGGAFEWVIQNNFSASIAESAKELTSQIQEIWQKGTLGSDLLKIIITGDTDYKELEEFRGEVLKFPEVKLLRDRYFEKGKVTLEASSAVPREKLFEKIKATKLSQRRKIEVL